MVRSNIVRWMAPLAFGLGTWMAACGTDNSNTILSTAGQGGVGGQAGVGHGGSALGGSGQGGVGTGGHSQAGASGAGGQAGAGGMVPQCSGLPINASGALDLDLKSIVVHGSVTLNGAALPDVATGRGVLALRETLTGEAVKIDLRSTGAMTYAATLPPGDYDIDFEGNAQACTGPESSPMPCNAGPLIRNKKLAASGALDIDITSIAVQGKVTVNGQPMPTASGERGTVGFALKGGAVLPLKSFGATGAANYAASLLAGEYDITFQGSDALCQGSTPPQVPCNAGPIKTAVQLTSSGALDLDVPSMTVQGAVTLDGKPMPVASAERGTIDFELQGGRAISAKGLGANGAASYGLTLLSGTYSVSFRGNEALCQQDTPSSVPCNRGPVKTQLSLVSSGVLDIDVPSVTVQGSVTVNGKAMGSASADRGALSFSLREGAAVQSKALGSGGPAVFAVRLLSGNYDIAFQGNETLCQKDTPEAVPCNAGTVKSKVSLVSNGALDIDVPAVTVQGNVTINGQPMPDASADRGSLSFSVDKGKAVRSKAFGSSGAAKFAATLISGVYAVSFEGNEMLCQADTAPLVPCNSGPVKTGVGLSVSGALDIDVPAATMQGKVTLNGQPMPNATGDRGGLRFGRVEGSSMQGRMWQAAGPVTYGVTILAGLYVIGHGGRAELCDGTQAPAVPCVGQVLMGCP